MEFAITIIFLIVITVIVGIIYNFSMKDVKAMAENKELDDIIKKMPSNIEICKAILKKLNNESVTIEEDEKGGNCLYIAMTNKIFIGNLRQSYTRVQTIAHECLHSIQDKRILKFNFIYSNIYLIFFATACILAIFKNLPYKMMFLSFMIIASYLYYFVRSYLENDAMIKARFLAKEYMEESRILTADEIDKVVTQYDKLNHLGIKFTNYDLMFKTFIKIIIFAIICIIR